MKKLLIMFSCLAVTLVALQGCYKDVINPGDDPDGPPMQVSFGGDLIPIFEKNCAISGCHDGVPTKKPSLTAKNAFNSLTTGGYVNTITPDQSGIYMSVKGNSMPVGGSLTTMEKRKILDWIRNGAPNN
jgi:hypothetical protein